MLAVVLYQPEIPPNTSNVKTKGQTTVFPLIQVSSASFKTVTVNVQ